MPPAALTAHSIDPAQSERLLQDLESFAAPYMQRVNLLRDALVVVTGDIQSRQPSELKSSMRFLARVIKQEGLVDVFRELRKITVGEGHYDGSPRYYHRIPLDITYDREEVSRLGAEAVSIIIQLLDQSNVADESTLSDFLDAAIEKPFVLWELELAGQHFSVRQRQRIMTDFAPTLVKLTCDTKLWDRLRLRSPSPFSQELQFASDDWQQWVNAPANHKTRPGLQRIILATEPVGDLESNYPNASLDVSHAVPEAETVKAVVVTDAIAKTQPKATKGKNINARMLVLLQKNQIEVIGWSAVEWGLKLDCHPSTVKGAPTWNGQLKTLRTAAKLDKKPTKRKGIGR